MGQNGHTLVFDDKFDRRPPADQIAYLKKLAGSQNHALDLMQQERNTLAGENAELKTSLLNAQDALDAQKAIVTNLITQTNAEGQHTAARIQELEARVRAQDRTIEALNGDRN